MPAPTADAGDVGPQVDEHAAMRRVVAREYADALGKRYEPPSGEADVEKKPGFENVEIDKRKISEYVMNAGHPDGRHTFRVINSATGLTAGDADQIEAQIRAGVRNGTPVAGKSDEHGQRWSVDVPVTGPAGAMTVRTGWIVEPGSDQPRLTTVSLLPTGR
ncbi:DUF6883 domain-containing protein [Micromonospora rifamycinica]|uniref:DUF6883 domain-containing protein n=1 Tax=Micromonospora rifamycinica TaxID=291594 RepID=UPI0012FB3CA1|nr:DUF6883 domain-containing protein [Micromonospora rifamycinica]